MDVGDRILFGCQEFGDAVRSRSRIVTPDGHQQLNVVFDEQVEVEIFFEVFVRRFETTHRQERSAAIEDVVGQQEVDLGDFRRVGEQSGISACSPSTRYPFCKNVFATLPTTVFIPGAGPPPVKIAIASISFILKFKFYQFRPLRRMFFRLSDPKIQFIFNIF